MDWPQLVLIGTIIFVILFILTGIVVSVILVAVMRSSNK